WRARVERQNALMEASQSFRMNKSQRDSQPFAEAPPGIKVGDCSDLRSLATPKEDLNEYECRCNYALCREHFSAGASTLFMMHVRTAIANFIGRGGPYIFAKIIVVLAFSIYTPVMQASLMIVTCHPYYRCQFPQCWSKVDASFGSAAYIALLAIAVVGVGF